MTGECIGTCSSYRINHKTSVLTKCLFGFCRSLHGLHFLATHIVNHEADWTARQVFLEMLANQQVKRDVALKCVHAKGIALVSGDLSM